MAKYIIKDLKLGLFVITGIILLVFALYMIGKNRSLFTDNFELRAQFKDVEGLMPGNNVRYAGIQAGTVKHIYIINDTTIEVTMLINETAGSHIRKNSIASIGTEGLMGNKVVNIVASKVVSPRVDEDDILLTVPRLDISNAMTTLAITNDNAGIIAAELVETVRKINSSPAVWQIMTDTTLPLNIRASLRNIAESSERLNRTTQVVEHIITETYAGTSVAGVLLSDTTEANNIRSAISHLQNATKDAHLLTTRLDHIASTLEQGANDKNTIAYTLLRDTLLSQQINNSLQNIETGTAAFSENMEALKHNFLFRRYFKKKNKEK